MNETLTMKDSVQAEIVGKGYNDLAKMIGTPILTHRGSNGAIKGVRIIRNLIVSAGKAGMASRLNGSGGEAAFTYLAVGTGTTSPAAGNTALEAEIVDSGLARVNATASRVTTSVANDTARLTTTFTVTGTKAVTEAGILNASSSGTLLCRQVFSAVNVINGDSLQLTYSVQNS
jgi:hypothetical protein